MIGDLHQIDVKSIPKSVLDAGREEANSIWESPYSRTISLGGRERDFQDVLRDTTLGKIGEFLLKSKYDYTEDNSKWHDLISPQGVRTEVKTWREEYVSEASIDGEVKRIRRRKDAKRQWFFSTKMIVILFNKERNTLFIHGIYDI